MSEQDQFRRTDYPMPGRTQVVWQFRSTTRDFNGGQTRGEVIVIFGPSGSGKSTFIRTLNRLEEHQKGKIVIDGIELTKDVHNIEAVRMETGMVFQQFNLFPHLNVLENITLAPVQVRKWKKDQARGDRCAVVGTGRNPRTSGKISQPSSRVGQQQRVAIARALAMQPKIMLFDEPTSALDPRND